MHLNLVGNSRLIINILGIMKKLWESQRYSEIRVIMPVSPNIVHQNIKKLNWHNVAQLDINFHKNKLWFILFSIIL